MVLTIPFYFYRQPKDVPMQSNKVRFFAIIGVALILVVAIFAAVFLLRNNDPIILAVLYSTEKVAWLEAVTPQFQEQVNGRPIQLQFEKMGSYEIYSAVLDGSQKPVLISPA